MKVCNFGLVDGVVLAAPAGIAIAVNGISNFFMKSPLVDGDSMLPCICRFYQVVLYNNNNGLTNNDLAGFQFGDSRFKRLELLLVCGVKHDGNTLIRHTHGHLVFR